MPWVANWHVFQILSKRSSRLRDFVNRRFIGTAPNHLWLGVSVEDRNTLLRIDHLREANVAVRFLSIEPLLEDLGALDLTGRRLHESLASSHTDAATPSVEADKESRAFSAMYTHPYNGLRPLQIDQIKRQLLFFPKVAIVRPDLRYSRELSEAISSVKRFLDSLLELKELLRDGTVELIPLSGFYSNEIEGGAGLIRRACEEDEEIVRWLQSKSNMIGDFATSARRGDLTLTLEFASHPH